MAKIRVESLKERAEEAAKNLTYVYRTVYILVAAGLIIGGIWFNIPFWAATIGLLLGAVALDLFEYVATIISTYMSYRKLVKDGHQDDDTVEYSEFNTFYWSCWSLKMVFTVGIIISLGYNLFNTYM